MHTVLIAGGAGFIGSHLSQKLIDEGNIVLCVDNFITGDRKNIESLLNNKNFKLIEHDIIKSFETDQKVDYIFHLASPASPNKKSPKSFINYPIETLMANSLGTKNLLELAKKNSAKFLYASSSEVYGNPNVSPQPESYFGNVSPNGVRSVYDEGKRFGEAMTMVFFRKHNVKTIIIRIFNTYGPKMQADDGRVVSNFINQAIFKKPITVYGKGDQTRSFCYVDDMVNGLTKAMFSSNSDGEVINIGNPDERTIKNLADLIKKMTDSNSEIIFEKLPEDDPLRRNPDISKAKDLLNWKPEVAIEKGLEKTIQYFKSL
ncbi:MAG TPA: UDP-glucuronic acid decarboxylase family protein [Patescibacteria group bacterium]|nr:UDP-glucuronic acid decarboxylase family protein [Patescibacteria group bacterium]